ncbi:uncharacterized protein J8A68_005632 [[Candida] subhashii]|uniref:Uncharacterized protein n=1 Tax=[Candida] subhashii TaxID=561895 RepID=A0A8J5USM7_9ASCO|nr:uncharacterized protein J8A68_005632 [[Candida] subhashii]KAG7660815.1 hypothetical protein J8A68_005632 [[Candida] subhashii]
MSNFASSSTHVDYQVHIYHNQFRVNFKPPVPREPMPAVFGFDQLQQTYTELETNLANALTTIPQKVKNISNDQNTQIRDLNSEIQSLSHDLLAIQLQYPEESSNLDTRRINGEAIVAPQVFEQAGESEGIIHHHSCYSFDLLFFHIYVNF